MQHTKIEWALNPDGTPGFTWNPITGCLNNCSYCYARKLANTRLRATYLANNNLAPSQFGTINPSANEIFDPFYPRFWPERLRQLGNAWDRRTWHKNVKGIFVCDMSDLFGIGIPEEWTRQVLSEIADTPHRFYLLTKQSQNLIKFSPFPDNAWVGVTATDDSMFRRASIELMKVKAKVKYISFEPLLAWSGYFDGVLKRVNSLGDRWMKQGGIKWVIIGGQTKPTIMPKMEWVEEIIRACDKAGVKVFLKNSLLPLIPEGIRNIAACDSWLIGKPCGELRQEFPDE